MRRVMVIGCGGAGKSTLARILAARLELPLIHLDFHYWGPNWKPTDNQHRQRIVSAIERFGNHLHVVRLLDDRDAADFLATPGGT
jgi:adenylate kinase family enzyme